MPGVTLSDKGRAQAAQLGGRLQDSGISAIYASPLARARETAEPIGAAAGVPVLLSEGFSEIDFGEWTGSSFSDLEADPRWRVWNESRAIATPPGGERMAEVQLRTAREIDRLLRQHGGGRVAVVSHCDVIKAVVCRVIGLSLDRYWAFDIDPASTSEVVVWDSGGRLVRLNEAVAP